MTTEDYDAIYQLWLSIKGMGLNNIDDSYDGICRLLHRNPDLCFVAKDKEAIIGTILAGDDGRRVTIYHLCVDGRYHRLGIGSKLLESLHQQCQKNNVTKINCVVFQDNHIGNSFWQNHGYLLREDLYYRDFSLKKIIKKKT